MAMICDLYRLFQSEEERRTLDGELDPKTESAAHDRPKRTPALPDDGKGSKGRIGTILQINDGVLHLEFTDYESPILQFIQGLDTIGVRIQPNTMVGDIDVCSGKVGIESDANFTSFMGG